MLPHLRFLVFLLLSLGLVCARPARASHAQAGTLTYVSLGGNSYRVRVDFIRDCSGIGAPTSFSLSCQTACGGTAITTVLALVGQPIIGTPYSAAIQPLAFCPLTGPAPTTAPVNFATYRYEGTVSLTPNQWKLAVEEGSRTSVTNATAGTLRLEATLDNRGRTNNSVTFSNIPTIFAPVNQPDLMHIGAYDVDGDSLSYSLDRPLNGCGTYETYSTYPTTACVTRVDPRCPYRILNCTGSASSYSQTLPIAVANDTVFENGTTVLPPCPTNIVSATVQPRFFFSNLQGTIAFTPNRYLNTPSANGDNKYLVVVKVTEWRRENGVDVAVGTTRRDLLWVVYDAAGNTLPRLAPTVTVQDGLQIRTQALSATIPVLAGEPISVSFSATNPGSTFPLALTLEQNTIPGAVMQAGTTAGTGRLTFTPPLTMPSGTYRVSLSVTDDASPLRNLITVPITFRVYRTVLATRSGSTPAISAYPTPFTERVQFQLPATGVQSLTICDNLGRVVARIQSQADGQVRWTPGPELPAGLYLARSADGRQTVRLLRNAAQ